ncbi:hypothetical protein [Sphingobacterium bovistauri]|uniref:DUF3828 domain-containing protein n=1 Tax=Sphingobacterium bovistauri TaxID=2781959 RepID=A0ABS7Z8Q6_9SPHI|nr:hypothetical protein [Sphingobacterium bovistauri]MCA5006578.1 hypothetical protein [Sphingobacterium bovistauri]
MINKWIGFILLLSVLIGCNEVKKSDKEQTRDTAMVVVPVTVDEQNQLAEVITRFARAYASKDNAKANALLHPDLGIHIIYRPGAADTFVKVDSLDFSKPVPEVYAYPEFSADYALAFDKLPTYDCGTEKWDILGFYCDTTSHPNQLSNIAAFEDEFEEDKFSEDDLIKLEVAEKESYRVIITADIPLIFHVRKYKGAWYVTTLDRAYAGCDA